MMLSCFGSVPSPYVVILPLTIKILCRLFRSTFAIRYFFHHATVVVHMNPFRIYVFGCVHMYVQSELVQEQNEIHVYDLRENYLKKYLKKSRIGF